MWARELQQGEPSLLVYRLYIGADEGVAEVRHLEFSQDVSRQNIAWAIIKARQEMREARGPASQKPHAAPPVGRVHHTMPPSNPTHAGINEPLHPLPVRPALDQLALFS